MNGGSEKQVSPNIQRSALVAALKAHGLKSPRGVKVIKQLCQAGQAQTALEAVAEVLLSTTGVPPNAGMMTRDLALAVEAALLDVTEEYHRSWNPLTPRYASVAQLHGEMTCQWVAGFRKPIPETLSVRGSLRDEEIGTKLAVMAQLMRDILLKRGALQGGMSDATCDSLVLKMDDLEPICVEAARTLFEAFEHPNEANHLLIHGEKP